VTPKVPKALKVNIGTSASSALTPEAYRSAAIAAMELNLMGSRRYTMLPSPQAAPLFLASLFAGAQ
jgi:hypothetical protein